VYQHEIVNVSPTEQKLKIARYCGTGMATEFRQLFYIQNFCDRNSVMHNKNQNATSIDFD
jgi:hypothetical protein